MQRTHAWWVLGRILQRAARDSPAARGRDNAR